MHKEALADLKVVDFSWGLAGPIVGKYLADFGAIVVKVESYRRPCVTRVSAPYKDSKPGVDRSGYFAFFNANKYSISLDLNNPKGIEVAKRLVAWSDIVVESFVPGQMERWGLAYEDLKKLKPSIVMLRTSSQGQSGPHAHFSAFGLVLTGLSGIAHLIGWPDGAPLPSPMAYSDLVAPRFCIAALLAAVDYRRRSGKGQCIDISQNETAIHFLAPAVLDYTVNNREVQRAGNSCPYAAPHGVYRCRGEDRWCALAVFTDEQWRAFSSVLCNPQWTKDTKFATLLGRKRNEAELNKLIEEWTINWTPEEVMVKMQGAKVPAGVVKSVSEVCEDPQLKHRGFLWPIEHEVLGEFTCLGQPSELSATPAKFKMSPPLLGQHTEYVCTKILGLSDKQFSELFQSGSLGV